MPGFSKKTPRVDAPPPKAAATLADRPYPVELPIMSTLLGESSSGLDFINSI